MNIDDIKQIGVVGSGAMGSQIAMVAALANYQVVLYDIEQSSLQKAKAMLQEQMEIRIKKGRYNEDEVSAAFNNLAFSSSIDSMRTVDFVIEAVVEKLAVKRKVFAELDEILPKHAILATNSSTIVSSKLADATNRPDKVCNVHFFNPVLKMALVEVVKGSHTSEETAKVAYELVENIGKVPVLLKREISGFLANRILGKILDESLYLLENGYATHEEIDLVCKKALGHPIGPFALMDLTGLDVNLDVRKQRYLESGNEADQPSKLVAEKVAKGELGRKTGKGFYSYR